MVENDDWRLRGQEEYMQNLKFRYSKYISEESGGGTHSHCEFCWHKFMENPSDIEDCSCNGYCSENKKYWVCEECFQDFQNRFAWEIENLYV